MATDAQTIAEVLAEFESAGYGVNLVAVEGGSIKVVGTEVEVGASEVAVAYCRRLEGVSDPADEVMVAAVELPDGTKGTLVLSYGMNASPADGDVLLALDVPT